MSTERKKKATRKPARKTKGKATTKKKTRSKATKADSELTPDPVLAEPPSLEPEVQLPSDEPPPIEAAQDESSAAATTDAASEPGSPEATLAAESASAEEPPAPEPELAPNHRKLIEDSAIDPEVARERGYRTITVRAELKRLGFSQGQLSVPTLLHPVHDHAGEVSGYQTRPDIPRVKDGKPLKYESPKGTRTALDIPPRARAWLGDPDRPLFITEGIRKADSAVSRELCCLALLGIWNWRGTNDHGGRTALAVWEYIDLKERLVYLVFDSDVMTKVGVHASLTRLKAFLESRGANVLVIYLPSAEGGAKVGLDDYFAAGHTVDEVLQLATTELRKLEGTEKKDHERFAITEDGHTLYLKRSDTGEVTPVELANFSAKIAAQIVEDDGVETRRIYELQALVRNVPIALTVTAERFAAMTWPTDLGAKAIVRAGQGTRDRFREAVQDLSDPNVPERRVYVHTGWIRHEEEWVYLHAGGAIGRNGTVPGIDVRLSSPLDRYVLAIPTPEEVAPAVRASLGILDGLAPDEVTFPIVAAVATAVTHSAGQVIHFAGETGGRKTEIAALCQRHFGESMDSSNLPASWSSTGNFLEGLGFFAKDAVLVIDDFNPVGSASDVQRMHREADRVVRGQANSSGRGRMRSDGTLRPTRHARGLIASTGEDVLGGHSLRARTWIVDVEPGCVNLGRLTECQAAGGSYSKATAAFIQWCAGRLDEIRRLHAAEFTRVRDRLLSRAPHGRTASLAAELLIGFGEYLRFAVDIGALTTSSAEAYKTRAINAMVGTMGRQGAHQSAADPARLFVDLVIGCLSSQEAHLIHSETGEVPEPEVIARAFGWRLAESTGLQGDRTEWRPGGSVIGAVDAGKLAVYLYPAPAYGAALRQSSNSPIRIGTTERLLWKALFNKGFLESTDEGRHTKKVRIHKRSASVLHFRLDTFYGEADEDGDEEVFPIPVPDNEGGEQQTGTESRCETLTVTPSEGGVPVVPEVPVPGREETPRPPSTSDAPPHEQQFERNPPGASHVAPTRGPSSPPGSGTTGTTGTTPADDAVEADSGLQTVPVSLVEPRKTGTKNGNKPAEGYPERALATASDEWEEVL